MMSSNWFKISIAAIIGVILGLVYGWVINPIQYTDITPNILRADYRGRLEVEISAGRQS